LPRDGKLDGRLNAGHGELINSNTYRAALDAALVRHAASFAAAKAAQSSIAMMR
jgi:hypothetical protein